MGDGGAMELYQLEYFRILCRCGSFTKASQELMVTQPAISIAMKKLEEEYGELIDRKQKRFTLTETGERLFKWAISIHKEVTNMSKELSAEFKNKRETIKIALPMPLCPELTTALTTTFVNEHPDISIELLQKGPHTISSDLMSRTIDIGVLGKDMLHPMLQYQDYGNVEFYACFSPEHRFNEADRITPDMLREETILLSQSVSSISAPIRAYFDRHGIQPKCDYYNILPEETRKLAQRGSGIAFGPKAAGEAHSAPLLPPLYCELVVAWFEGPLTSQERALIDFIVGSARMV